MELVMLGGINKEEFLASLDAEKQEHQEESVGCKIELFDPTAGIREVVDKAVLEKVKEFRKAKTKKAEAKTAEKKKFRNALMFTDIPATIKNAGFHPDGSPRVAIAGLFDDSVELVRGDQFNYSSDSLSVVLGSVVGDIDLGKEKYLLNGDVETKKTFIKNEKLSAISFILNLVSIIITLWRGREAIRYFFTVDMSEMLPLIMFFCLGFVAPAIAILLTFSYSQYDYVFLLDAGKEMIKVKTGISTKVPQAPESVLSQITGCGPFAILFEVTQGWKEVKPDPVIFRVINIGDKQFFEPMVGYDMTPLEKKSLVEKT